MYIIPIVFSALLGQPPLEEPAAPHSDAGPGIVAGALLGGGAGATAAVTSGFVAARVEEQQLCAGCTRSDSLLGPFVAMRVAFFSVPIGAFVGAVVGGLIVSSIPAPEPDAVN